MLAFARIPLARRAVNSSPMSCLATLVFRDPTYTQGFRKYVHQATDNDELLAFLLGQIIKDKVQLYRHQRGENPERVTVPLKTLEARAKELEIYDVAGFVKSRVFGANGYKVVGGGEGIEKVFVRVQESL